MALNEIARLVSDGQFDKAKHGAGGLAVIDSLWALLHPPRRPVEEAEAPFSDPAAINRGKK